MDTFVGVTWFEGLESEPEVLAAVDFVEVPGWLLAPAFTLPHERIILHNLDLDWSLAASDAAGDGWSPRLQSAIGRTGTPWFSIHLGFSAERVRFNGHMMPGSASLDRDELLSRFVRNVTRARSACLLPLLLENLDYRPEGAYEHVCDPSFIAEVLERTGAGLLFDLAHWRVSASWLGFDPVNALELLPLERALEIHVSSPRPLADGTGRLDDVHEPLTDADLDLLDDVLDRAAPHAITIEYVKDIEQLRGQIQQIRGLLDSRGTV